MNNKEKDFVHFKVLQESLNPKLKLTKFHRFIRLSQNEWLMLYIELNFEFQKNTESDFKKYFSIQN